MSLDPLSFQAPSLVLPAAAYQTNFWANLASADHPYPSVMSSPHTTFNFMDRNSDALVVYDAKDNSNVAQCVMIAADEASSVTSNATFLLSQNQVPTEYQLFGVSDVGFPSSFDLFKSNPMVGGVQNVSKIPSNKAPTQRQQHYHHRHHAQAHQAQVNNQKNKTRFSATGLSSNYTIVRDSKMSLSSAPSSPTAGSVGGSLSQAYAGIHATPMSLPSNPYTVQCKDSSSFSSSYSSKNFKMSASSSLSSYSSCSSLSSTPSMNGISPRKRRADDTANNNKQIPCRKEYFQRNEGEIINLCSCETCTTDDVTARVDDVTLRDMISGEQEQRQKRSKNDDDVVFVSAEPAGTNHRVTNYENQTQKERHLRKSRKSNKKVSPRDGHIVQAIPAAALSDSKPFIVPSSLTIPPRLENHQSNGRYFLRSTAKGRNQNKLNGAAHASPVEDANGVPPTACNYIQQTMVSPVVQSPTRMIDLNNNGNGRTYQPTTANSCQTAQTCSAVVAENTPSSPRYHTRSRQKKVKASAQASAGPVSSPDSCPTSVPYYPASVIQSVNSSTPSSSYATTTSSKTAPALDAVRESSTHTPSSSFKKIYDIHGIIGVGGGGTVYAGTRKSDGMQVAIKQVPKAKVKRWGKLNDRVVPIEFELLHRASHSSHKGIISMLDWYERRTTYILVMERPQPVIDLFDYLNQHGALSEAVARSIFRQIAEAVIHCHANGVVHRDIKDENILLNLHTSEAKLIDFGCGTVMKDAPYTEFAGTPEFYPPEWFTHRRYFGRRVDAWSMGVLLYTMVEAEVPFQKENDIVECKLRHKRAARLSDSCLHLIRWMLQKDQNMRPTIQQALTHPWFQQQQSSVGTTATTQPPIFTPVSRGVMDTDELYEKHLRLHQNGRTIQPSVGLGISSAHGNKQQKSTHSVACTDSPQSPPRKHEQSTVDHNQRQGSNYHAQQRPSNARGY